MDIIITLILMAALYIIPELLRGKKTKEYEYPEIPEMPDQTNMPNKPKKPVPQSAPVPPKMKHPYQHSKDIKQPSAAQLNKYMLPSKVSNSEVVSAPMLASIDKHTEQKAQFDQAMILNGVIWAEVLLPPRAHRPLGNTRWTNGK